MRTMRHDQATVGEMNQKRIGGKIKMGDTVYMSGENHGEVYYGTMEDWERVIPENETEARMTGYHDWYYGDDRRINEDMMWAEYRDEILDELIPVEIIDGRKIR